MNEYIPLQSKVNQANKLSKIYTIYERPKVHTQETSQTLPKIWAQENISLETIIIQLQNIKLQLISSNDREFSKYEIQKLGIDLCRSMELAFFHIKELKLKQQKRQFQHDLSSTQLLTRRQQQVLHLASQGLNNKDIAKKLNLSLPTVTYHLSQSFKILGVRSRGKAVAICIEKELI